MKKQQQRSMLDDSSDISDYAGNINLFDRPMVKNPDGSISTVRSMSFNEDGKEILVPTISDDGRSMSNDEAIQMYHDTGKYFGKFDSIKKANDFAQRLHRQQEQLLLKRRTQGHSMFGADNTQ